LILAQRVGSLLLDGCLARSVVASDDGVGLHGAVTAKIVRTAAFAIEPVAQLAPGCLTDVDAPRDALRLEPAGNVHGVAPDVEGELAVSDYTTDDWS
jgi:hypothetical protein